MLSFELKARQEKLERQQEREREQQRRRLEKEKLAKERQAQQEGEREAAKAAARLAQQAAAQAAEARQEALRESNRGVYLQQELQAAPLDEAAVAARGIRRARDKIVLPPSAGHELMRQDAPRNGAMLFELLVDSGRHTHAGVLEFTAPEGVVLLPSKVAACLWGPGAQPQGRVRVTYRRLEKGTFVRFQPLERGFQEEVGDDVRSVLEAALMGCCTLTEGDLISVAHGDKEYSLRVVELQPEPSVSVIDTDVEAEVVASVETEEQVAQLQAAAAREAARLEQLRAEREAVAAAEAEQAASASARAAAAAAEEEARKERLRLEKQALLPPEPPADAGVPLLTALFRLPDGSRLSRRFTLDTPLASLFDAVDAAGAGGWWPGRFSLVAQFPRRAFLPPGSSAAASATQTLTEAGLQPGQEAFVLEPLSEQPDQ